MEISDIRRKANQIYLDILKDGEQTIRKLFSKGNDLSEQIRFNEAEEYIKKMLLAQMGISKMLLIHKYKDMDYDKQTQFFKETDELLASFENSRCLKFDDELIENLFGNPLGIKSAEELEEWNNIIYHNGRNGASFEEIFKEESFMVQHENEKNPFKKFFGSFRYNKMKNTFLLEDSYTKRIREIIRNEFQIEPKSESMVYVRSKDILSNYTSEYRSLQAIDDISRTVLKSLMQERSNEPIDIQQTSETLRSEFQKDTRMTKVKDGYRKRNIILGNEKYEQVPLEQVGEAMLGLQQRYEDAFYKEQALEDYIKDLAKIVADFVYLQPYEDGNKRTAISLFNSMMMSKGLIPPPISIINDFEMGKAFEEAKKKDYTSIQEFFVSKYEKNLTDNNQEPERSAVRSTEKEGIENETGEIE